MRRASRASAITIAAASGVMAVTGAVHADSVTDGAAVKSAGLLSGNGVQLPVQLPLQVCGSTVTVVGLLNPAAGNGCAGDEVGAPVDEHPSMQEPGAAQGGSVQQSAGAASGNLLRLPVRLPVTISGNSVNLAGVGSPAFGNESSSTADGLPDEPVRPSLPPAPELPPVPPTRIPARSQPLVPAAFRSVPRPTPPMAGRRPDVELARTGADDALPTATLSLLSLLAGGLLYRGSRSCEARRQG